MNREKEERTGGEESFEHVHTAQGEIEAQLIRAMLEGDGIDAILNGEAVRLTHGLTVDGLARGQVLVRSKDATRARELIDVYRSDTA